MSNKNWQLTLPALATVQPMDPTRVRLPTGPYAGIIIDSEQMDAKEPGGAPSLSFTVRVTEKGDFEGKEVWIRMGSDFNKQGNQKAYRALMESVGAPAHVLNGPITLGPQSFSNKPCYIYIEAAPEGERPAGEKAYDNRNFITPTLYQKLKAQGNVAHTAGVAAPTFQPQVGQVPAGGFGAQPGLPGAPNGVNAMGGALQQPGVIPQPAPQAGGVTF